MRSCPCPDDAFLHREVEANGVRLHVAEAGTGPLVLLLHGFPEFWYAWRHQLPALAAAGFRAVAPDLRGYNLSEKPPGIASYAVEKLAADVAALVTALGEESAFVVGHDWGGALAWYLPLLHPGRVRRLAILNAPHPAAFRRELKRSAAQRKRSSYILFFQLPWLPERAIRKDDFGQLAKMLRRDPVRAGAFSADDVARYQEALSRPGALTAALNWYRAALRHPPRLPRERRTIDVPTLVVWGGKDRYLGPALAEGLERWVPDLVVERLPDASHWVPADAPERVNELLIRFFRA
ncbi:MAG TPA: alpha/beta hydrolase [Thermoanaerobaculia bacterium]|nr:alpha/beta hydrolase [Thermoanaerobaculia bacterium]HQR67736.1 alpha/beta hydrolase [Thermoanaerobaculia bacterium]